MFRQSVVMDFLTFVCFYVILKLVWHFVNIEARRKQWKTVSGVAGLLA